MGLSVIVSSMIVAFLVKKAPSLGLVDSPNERSSHINATPRGGGVGIVVTWLAGVIVWWCVCESQMSTTKVVVLAISALFVAGISLRDDFHSVGAAIRFSVHIGAAVVVAQVFGVFKTIEVGSVFQLAWLSLPLTIIWVVGLTNVFNFMDGIDGIAGLQGVAAGVAWAVMGFVTETSSAVVIGSLLAGGCLGFLCHNWSPAKIFMGDVGSAFLGFVFGVLPLAAMQELLNGRMPGILSRLPVFAIMVVWPFVADGSLTFCRRLLKREPVWKPHRTHMYQRLVQAGWSHARVSSYYGLWSVLCAAAGVGYLIELPAHLAAALCVSFAISTWALTLYLEHMKLVGKVTR
jgi:UDP-N-acetylmuramyl pentapeptide phosphotransferase/UDP-N-acetylglucosamine-1-phosphate transferase